MQLAPRVPKVTQAHKDFPVQLELLVLRDRKVLKAHKVCREILVRLVQMGLLAQRVQPAHKDRKVYRVRKAIPDHKACKV